MHHSPGGWVYLVGVSADLPGGPIFFSKMRKSRRAEKEKSGRANESRGGGTLYK